MDGKVFDEQQRAELVAQLKMSQHILFNAMNGGEDKNTAIQLARTINRGVLEALA